MPLIEKPKFQPKTQWQRTMLMHIVKNCDNRFFKESQVRKRRTLGEQFLDAYNEMGCRMSWKINSLHAQFSFLPSNHGAVSDEYLERFLQDVRRLAERYSRQVFRANNKKINGFTHISYFTYFILTEETVSGSYLNYLIKTFYFSGIYNIFS